MWLREELKSRAKAVLKLNYWKAFLISIVIGIAGGNGGGGGSSRTNFNNHSDSGSWTSSEALFSNFKVNIFAIIALGAAIVFVIIVIVLAFRIFIGYPLEVGGRRYFVKSARYEDNRNCFSFAFYRENYSGIVFTMLLKGLQNFLWYLLFIIPGIVKSYSYSMVPYILADNPNIGNRRAIELSNNMTDGHKLNMFVLDLSFILWYLLCMVTLGLGFLFLQPYLDATKAELYLVLRENSLNMGLCTSEELQY
ncbi:uncharacterized protein DUF975 [Ruminiclostridium sufflavum DSM 19573]|uniref:Uncharacterized protein DUF975 n=1 Tax=Ruminiclostridium sufflavum DSM 19573 TaxID=1121337 RepID=A0A318XNX1_9FIRM|nr:DUF975 family protein [Ruminiclostridium sufflavum]PYG88526.1 uncharacterized protein DUF975 [Ruminiclostridium sufflavum DSM 19573]